MSGQSEEKLDRIIEDLGQLKNDNELIKKALKIVPDRDTTIQDYESTIQNYEQFAKDELKLGQATINNQKSVIRGFLNHSDGIITKETVKAYLDSNDENSWKTNQLKALRKYIREHLKLGNWINEFTFAKSKAKVKSELPTDEQLAYFVSSIENLEIQIIFLILLNSGLRIGEVLKLRISNIDFETNMIDASELHEGDTKSSWISFFTTQTNEYLQSYVDNELESYSDDPKLFAVNYKAVQEEFKRISEITNTSINPHLLRTIFSEKCREANLDKEYINAFEGRTQKGILDTHYTDYSPKALRKKYDIIEPFLTLKHLE